MSWFDGKHALVTGGGSGIGAAVASVLVDKGAKVTICGRNQERLQSTAAELGAAMQVVDVTDHDQVAAAFRAAESDYGAIDVLINNAGSAESSPFGKMDDDTWERMMSVNLDGVYYCCREAIGGMLESGSGRIVNVASIAGLHGAAYIAAYCAAKHGVVGLTRALAAEFARKNITVNAVCPGYVDTEIVRTAIDNISVTTGRSREKALAELVKTNPQGRLITPEEVADTVIWLCRQQSVNGQAIVMDGGGLA
jgi:NAD(P)-dependent dehydrogenase (short-subunit alcohol dehydrogenase family)